MTQEEVKKYLSKNKAYISFRAIANEIGMDVSNFHKFVNGEMNLKPEMLSKVNKIIAGLSPKTNNKIKQA